MDYNIMALNLIYLFNLILFLYFIRKLFFMLYSKTTGIYTYKILDKFLSLIIIIIYISLIIIGLYLYRIYNIGHQVDLKLLLKSYHAYTMLNIPLIFKFYFVLYLILLLIIFFLLLLNIHKISTREIFNTYIFLNYMSFLRGNKYTRTLYNFCTDVGLYNIISFSLKKTCYHIELFLKELEISHGAIYKEFEMPDYKFSAVIHNMVHHRFLRTKSLYTFDIILYYFIPLSLITYDIIINNLVLTHIFYYLPIIIPIKLLQKLTKTIAETDPRICDLMWEIYYKKENCIYASTKEKKILLDTYISNGLQMLPGLDVVFLSEHLYVFSTPLCFKLIDKQHKFYQNNEGVIIQEDYKGDFIIVEDYLFDKYEKENSFITYGEKMILILDKRK